MVVEFISYAKGAGTIQGYRPLPQDDHQHGGRAVLRGGGVCERRADRIDQGAVAAE